MTWDVAVPDGQGTRQGRCGCGRGVKVARGERKIGGRRGEKIGKESGRGWGEFLRAESARRSEKGGGKQGAGGEKRGGMGEVYACQPTPLLYIRMYTTCIYPERTMVIGVYRGWWCSFTGLLLALLYARMYAHRRMLLSLSSLWCNMLQWKKMASPVTQSFIEKWIIIWNI